MIIFSKFGDYGRFGNQLFQLAFLHSASKKLNSEYAIPAWEYSKYFKNSFNETSVFPAPDRIVKELGYRYDESNVDRLIGDDVVDIIGYYQHEEYFTSRDEIRDLFAFKDEYVDAIRDKYSNLLSRPTIAVCIRRTDYINNPNYYQLPVLYYILALQRFEYNNFNLIFISDDLEWCRFHFKCLENAYFPEDSDINQFILSTLCDNWIIANSTFHWWSAYLGEKPGSRVIQPAYYFSGPLLKKEGNYNFYLDRWETLDHEGHQIDLTDVTFTIPVSFDHQDRKDNLELNVCLIQKNFKTNIIVGEQGTNKFEFMKEWVKYVKFDYKLFHRTKMLNEMAKMSETGIIANYDADVAFAPMQILKSVELLRNDEADMVYPYEYLFVRIPKTLRNRIYKSYDIGAYADCKIGQDTPDRPSVGGALFLNKGCFFEAGGENEYMISYAPEDVERFERFIKLGYRVMRVKGNLYHFDHWIGPNSSMQHEHYKTNRSILEEQRKLTVEELAEEVRNWPWIRQQYDGNYYDAISPGSRRSAKRIMQHLSYLNYESVLDLGCGVGQWASAFSTTYMGVDYNIPQDRLLIQKTNFINHDLREPFLYDHLFDLVLCMEVAEHIDKRYAEILVSSICNASNRYVLFSAAIPGQGGHGHINEQWQSYWVKLFGKQGFILSKDQPRLRILDDLEIEYWYRQNILLFQHSKVGGDNSILDPYLDFVLPNNKK